VSVLPSRLAHRTRITLVIVGEGSHLRMRTVGAWTPTLKHR
jgi:hypothetical protein